MSFVSEFVKTVHNECNKYEVCTGCVFYDNRDCLFHDNPEMWNTEKIINAYYELLKGGETNE